MTEQNRQDQFKKAMSELQEKIEKACEEFVVCQAKGWAIASGNFLEFNEGRFIVESNLAFRKFQNAIAMAVSVYRAKIE